MPKTDLIFKVPLNILLADDGTKEALIAIAYYRGDNGVYGGPARDGLGQYVKEWVANLSPADRKRFNEILDQVKLAEKMKAEVRADRRNAKPPTPAG